MGRCPGAVGVCRRTVVVTAKWSERSAAVVPWMIGGGNEYEKPSCATPIGRMAMYALSSDDCTNS